MDDPKFIIRAIIIKEKKSRMSGAESPGKLNEKESSLLIKNNNVTTNTKVKIMNIKIPTVF